MKKIETQTYRIGEYVVFKKEDGRWQMGRPIDDEEPLFAFVQGTVTIHSTLRDAKSAYHARKRLARMGK